jgi:hypothetical protein
MGSTTYAIALSNTIRIGHISERHINVIDNRMAIRIFIFDRSHYGQSSDIESKVLN